MIGIDSLLNKFVVLEYPGFYCSNFVGDLFFIIFWYWLLFILIYWVEIEWVLELLLEPWLPLLLFELVEWNEIPLFIEPENPKFLIFTSDY